MPLAVFQGSHDGPPQPAWTGEGRWARRGAVVVVVAPPQKPTSTSIKRPRHSNFGLAFTCSVDQSSGPRERPRSPAFYGAQRAAGGDCLGSHAGVENVQKGVGTPHADILWTSPPGRRTHFVVVALWGSYAGAVAKRRPRRPQQSTLLPLIGVRGASGCSQESSGPLIRRAVRASKKSGIVVGVMDDGRLNCPPPCPTPSRAGPE